MSSKGICQLCLQETNLIKQSHIIPKFMYKGMTGPDNAMLLESRTETKYKSKQVHTGIFDKNILCSNCDNVVIGRLERYAASIIYGGNLLSIKELMGIDGFRSILVSGIDYQQFKLFLLSVLWRTHISKNPFFQDVNLGTKAEMLRRLILTGITPADNIFKVSIFALKLNRQELVRLVASPRVVENGKVNMASFMINGYMYSFNLQQEDSVSHFSKCYLKSDGTIAIPVFEPDNAKKFLRSYFNGIPLKSIL